MDIKYPGNTVHSLEKLDAWRDGWWVCTLHTWSLWMTWNGIYCEYIFNNAPNDFISLHRDIVCPFVILVNEIRSNAQFICLIFSLLGANNS